VPSTPSDATWLDVLEFEFAVGLGDAQFQTMEARLNASPYGLMRFAFEHIAKSIAVMEWPCGFRRTVPSSRLMPPLRQPRQLSAHVFSVPGRCLRRFPFSHNIMLGAATANWAPARTPGPPGARTRGGRHDLHALSFVRRFG
jgi:hypothetical protein